MFEKVNILGIEITNISKEETIHEIEKFIKNKVTMEIVPVNVDMLVKSMSDSHFKDILKNKTGLLIPDGMPLVWASYLLKKPLKEKTAGSDLFFKFCEIAALKGYKLFFLGSAEGVAQKAAEILTKKHKGLKIVGTYAPHFGFENDQDENKKIINMIKATEPDILFVAFGAPKQEKWIHEYKKKYKVPISIAIGATFDFAAGNKKMPPQWVKRIGFAWLWRLLEEPKRLWKRYLIEDIKFFYYILLQKLRRNF